MGSNLPIVLIEVVLIFGGVLAFGAWQLRSLARDRAETLRQRALSEAAEDPSKNAGAKHEP